MAELAAMTLAASTPKVTPMLASEYAARCKAAARVMQIGLSIPTDGWRDLQRDISYWEGRHRDAQGDPMRRHAEDAAATTQFGAPEAGRTLNARRAVARPIAEQCRRQREAAR